jgi:hypothetical protein
LLTYSIAFSDVSERKKEKAVNQSVPCCRRPATLTNARSPFSKVLALGFYDGPTSGLLQCETCSAVYYFDMLDWDDDHEVRVFRLAPLPPNSLEECAAAFARTEAPQWPVWVLWVRTSPPAEVREAVDTEVQQILQEAGPAELLIAWTGYGERILAATKVPAEELQGVPDWFSLENSAQARDWFSVLGLVRNRNGSPKASSAQPGSQPLK